MKTSYRKLISLTFAFLIIASCNSKKSLDTFESSENITISNSTNNYYQNFVINKADDIFLEDLSKKAFKYFIEQSDPTTGLVLDRSPTNGGVSKTNIASSASTGFGLSAFCIGLERGWISKSEARKKVFTTLKFFAEKAPQEHGWFLHFMDKSTGARRWESEYSSIDTALFLAGVLTAKQYFKSDAEIVKLATTIYERVDFKWMLNAHPSLLSHGWTPEKGFIPYRWDTYSEHMILQMLAIGSPTNPIPSSAWNAWKRTEITYGNYNYINSGPLFTHQYSPSYIDFRHQKDNSSELKTDFFVNSIKATKAHKEFCLSLSKEFPAYSENIWGITASDSAKGYVAWGGPPLEPEIDGTVVPCAAGGSLMFTPDISIPALKEMKEKYGKTIYARYGFVDAFNPNNSWVGPDVIGIDVGITLLSAENLRTGNIWKWFMQNKEIPNAMKNVGLEKY
ncbi:MAG: glucoamylase family protein [Cyanobacteriota bacterium]